MARVNEWQGRSLGGSPTGLDSFGQALDGSFVVVGKFAAGKLLVSVVEFLPEHQFIEKISCLGFGKTFHQAVKLFFRGHDFIMSSAEIVGRDGGDFECQWLNIAQLYGNRALLILQYAFDQ